jgi:hypothetical protein
MKVYILFLDCGEYDPPIIYGVYSSFKIASEVAKKAVRDEDGELEDYYLNEVELDGPGDFDLSNAPVLDYKMFIK